LIESASLSLSPLIRFGASTWTYESPARAGLKREYKKTTFDRECLGEYSPYLYNGEPLFRTIGNDPTLLSSHQRLISLTILIKDAIRHNRRAHVLVNNRLEGNAPLTVRALTDLFTM
jgi:hypothetical protein